MATSFLINGRPYTVNLASLPADISLNTFIRDHAGLTGTKFMCQEGGCGVCVCAVTGQHPTTGEIRTWAVNSCLTLLNTCADLEITTVEGIGSKRTGYHAIQKRLAKMNGTQCGYCSPGFVMNMYALLKAKNGKVTMEEVENSFGGNICRCTGYRPILDAMKSFAVDSNIDVPAECRDIEDLSAKTCPKTGDLCSGTCKGAARPSSAITYADGSQWYWQHSLADIFKALAELKDDGEKYMLVAGNTAHGVYRRPADVKTFIDVNGVAELSGHSIADGAVVLGGNLTLTETMAVLKEAAKRPGFEYCQQLWHHFDLIANVPVRNTGTLAGNLAIKHQHREFPSDIYVVFEALDVQVVINTSATAQRTLSLEKYLSTAMTKKVVHSFVLKPYPREKYIFDSYKIMQRAQNTHAYVNAAFLVQLTKPGNIVQSARICFGGIRPDFVHATAIETLLKGKNLFDPQMVTKALGNLRAELKPDTVLPDASPAYREHLAHSLFYKFLLAHAPTGVVPKKLLSGGEMLKRPVSSGKQTFDKIEKNYPISKPTAKHEGLIQVAGEATFANDLPTQPNQLWAAFITAKKVGRCVKRIRTDAAMSLPGVVAYYLTEHIPGKNLAVGHDQLFFPENEELFARDMIKFYNQPVGMVVAETHDAAQRAAELVDIEYFAGSTEVLPTLADVLNSASTDRIEHNIKSLVKELKIDDPYDYKGSGKIDMGLQYHYTMEPQTTVAVPFEGGLQLYCATQWMDVVQFTIANLLLLKNNEVQVKVPRVGGGYGGKASRCLPAACAAALAAYKLNRPVRFVQSLESMMDMLGKRWACLVNYDFYAKKSGKIVAIRSEFYEDAGYLRNESPMGHTMLLSKNCYEFSDNYKLDGYLVLTDSPNNCACRAPGSVEGIAIIENIMEHVAFKAGLDPADVRLANIIPNHKMGEMLPRFVQTTQYKQRRQEIESFNAQNRWRKKGLGLAVSEYHVGYFGQYPATVAIYHGDGTILISHGGIEMGQGMNTKITQVVAFELGVPIEVVKVQGSESLNGANAMVTGGSVGSEALCYAVRNCCNTLNKRLKPVKETIKDGNWNEIIDEAHRQQINLIASDDFKQTDMDPYTVCGVCITEVEVDILTGNYLVSRVDILEDTGESLNPSIDIGQIEGAFMMGLGYWTSEQIVVDKATGELKTNRSWNYKPPGAKDIPIDFRIELLPQSSNTAGFMRSKATGEPAICLAVAVAFALQHALQSARHDAGLEKKWITLAAPMTPEYIALNAGTDVGMLQLQ